MADLKNQSALESRLAGAGGDHYIGTQAVSNKYFEVIRIGDDGATLVGVQAGGVDIKTSRNYPAAMPGGYLICADGDIPINHIELSAGWAEGWIMPTWVQDNQ